MVNEIKKGAPILLDEERHSIIVQVIREDLALSQGARAAGLSTVTLKNWMKQGEEDLKNNIDSNFAHLFSSVRAAQREHAKEILEKLRKCPSNYGALTWILQNCLREDFGVNVDLEEDLKERIVKLEELLRQYLENPIK